MKKPCYLKNMFYPSRVLSKSPCFSKILTINLDKIVTKKQKYFFRHKSILKLKNWREQNQAGIKFYNVECVEFIFGTFVTEISRNLYFPHFRLFSNFCPFVIFSSKWYMQNILCINSNLPLTKGGLIKYEKGIRTISVHFERFWLLSWYLLFPKNTLHLQQLNDISIQIGRNCVQIPERHAIDERGLIKHEKGSPLDCTWTVELFINLIKDILNYGGEAWIKMWHSSD